ncbi:archease [Halomonas campisalis]|uniref:Archease n=1 Tax=Billgrantia campisalis TaxID=74661 RepID=A0ABS9PD92_9GAMM|nr:archease [Halomonas campisalis]MCG6659227.1 archease [Halomonas campisalis]MDR5864225.1 archease [Halomonas campisalis]
MTDCHAKGSVQGAGWSLLPHDADVLVNGWGATLEAAFEQAALALTGVVTDALVAPRQALSVSCSAPDRELLLVEWLNTVIYEMAVRGMLFCGFQVAIESLPVGGYHLSATLFGEPLDRVRHAPACEAKGATYTALQVSRSAAGGWSASCVVDV